MKKQIRKVKENNLIINIVEDVLDELGVNMATKGYKLWPEAVILARKNNYENITNLYIDIAKRHKSTPSKVERALRHSHEDIKNEVQKYFKLNYRISNKVFLECLIKKVRVIHETAESVEN